MLFEQTNTKLVLNATETQTLENAYAVLTQLMQEMEDNGYDKIVTDNFDIYYVDLNNTTDILDALVVNEKLEVE